MGAASTALRPAARWGTPAAWVNALVLLGLALRAFGYLRDPSMWHDEAAAVLNVLGKNFAEMLGPLFCNNPSPPLFLWAERAVVLILGDSTYALRLLPFLASAVALVLFVRIARDLLAPAAVPWAVFLFAINDHLLWHASEAKPYSIDVLGATVLLLAWSRGRGLSFGRRLLWFGLPAPLIIWASYPGCFLYGGVLLALLPALWRERTRPTAWLAYAGLALTVVVSFLLLYLGPIRAQRNTQIDSCWGLGFPAWDRSGWAVLGWAVKSTLDACCYCCAPVGNLLAVFAAIGALWFWRGGQRSVLLLLLAPAGLALTAALIGAYPYCGSRIIVYLTPALVLLLAAGLWPVLAWLRERSRLDGHLRTLPPATDPGSPTRQRGSSRPSLARRAATLAAGLRISAMATATLVLLVLASVGRVAYATVFPQGRADSAAASRYVLAEHRSGELVVGNCWEHSYYFRHLGQDFRLDEPSPGALPGRLWLVVTAATPELRDEVLAAQTPDGWRCVQRREFHRTSVVLLQGPPDGIEHLAGERPGMNATTGG